MNFSDFLDDILTRLRDSKAVRLQGGSPDRLRSLLLGAMLRGPARIVVCLARDKDLFAWQDFAASLPPVLGVGAARLPTAGVWGQDRFANQSAIRSQRLYALSQLQQMESCFVVCSIAGLLQKTLPQDEFARLTLELSVGQEYDQDSLLAELGDRGYFVANSAEEEGAIAVRGGIVDIFPVNATDPIRLEFFADELQSIRSFSADTQRSISSCEQVRIFPAQEVYTPALQRKIQAQRIYEFLLTSDMEQSDREGINHSFIHGHRFQGFDCLSPLLRENSESALDFLRPRDIIVFPQSYDACAEAWSDFMALSQEAHEKDIATRRPSLGVSEHFYLEFSLPSKIGVLEANNPLGDDGADAVSFPAIVEPRSPSDTAKPTERFDRWLDIANEYLGRDYRIFFLAEHADQRQRIQQLITHRDMKSREDESAWSKFLATGELSSGVFVSAGQLASYIVFEADQVLVISDRALFGQSKAKRKPASRKLQNYLSSFKELKLGGLVVHVDHGIGRYLGLKNIDAGGSKADYLVLEYFGGDKVYLPVDRLSMLQRYSGRADGGLSQRVDRLQSPSWAKRKAKVRKAVKDMAEELLRTHAERKLAPGICYSPRGESYAQLEADFPFAETDDQLRAIQDVQSDMGEARAMDRLICGDVGFGKTEVALRAAYRSVLDGFQVLLLVPTTVLCYQHYRTFQERLSKHGVRVAQLNRFVGRLESSEALAGLERGTIDVLVGTHRILSKDIKPRKLGLLIVDEEQRFGVTHKEKLKTLRAGCDILTLSATPIPRTLHMSMLGMRDISIIATPPQQRLAVKTYVTQFDEELVRETIRHEVERGGQVFYLHNRVEDIEQVCGMLRTLLPDVKIQFAHGQMSEHRLERVIVDFIEQKFSVLVCTTIIESGIDMPAVNTLIVDDAQRFGLSQLYQIRGRVGRSTRQAYAYFLTPKQERLSDEARRRLDVLSTHQELGSGFQIASHDLEIRGAGNLLGAEQSGRVSDVGLELYTQLLEEAIGELKGSTIRPERDAELKLPVSAIIPKSYIEDENLRLHLYKQMFSEDSSEGLRELRSDTSDRFGRLSEDMELLFAVAELKRLLRKLGATQIGAAKRGDIEIRFESLAEGQIDRMLEVASSKPKQYRLAPDYRLSLCGIDSPGPGTSAQLAYINQICGFIQPLVFAVGD